MQTLLSASVQIDVNWLLGVIGILGTVIGTMAGAMWASMLSRLKKQDKVIETQGQTIKHLEEDVKRLSKGCGLGGCVWKNRD